MLEINNHIIMQNTQDILLELKRVANLNDLNIFHKFTTTSSNIMTTCPFHKNGQERKPSFGILTKDSKDLKAGQCHCFTCGWSGSFPEMISNIFGYDDFGLYGEKWLIRNFQTVSIDTRDVLDLDLSRSVTKKEIKYVSEDELDRYRYYHSYMKKRKLSDEVIDIFDIGYDKNTNCLTFPVRDVFGRCLFIARRSVVGKYFNYPNNVEKPIYGLYELEQNCDIANNEIYICESMINALTIWSWGKYAVALNGTGSASQYEILKKMNNRKFILALDPDSAGDKGVEKLKYHLQNKILTRLFIPQGKDVNDLTYEEFNNLTEIYC